MKIRAKNGEQTVDITLPATDMDIQYCMKRIGIEDIVPVCCISEVRDEPSYFGFLKGQTVNMDELNFLARRLDGMTEYEKRVVGVYSSETGIREMKQLINLTYSLQGLSLITDLTDGNRVGLRLYLDRHLAISAILSSSPSASPRWIRRSIGCSRSKITFKFSSFLCVSLTTSIFIG